MTRYKAHSFGLDLVVMDGAHGEFVWFVYRPAVPVLNVPAHVIRTGTAYSLIAAIDTGRDALYDAAEAAESQFQDCDNYAALRSLSYDM